jgi:hypothetical protein
MSIVVFTTVISVLKMITILLTLLNFLSAESIAYLFLQGLRPKRLRRP